MNITIIRKRRQQLNITQQELSYLSGVSLANYQNIENAKANPSLETLERLLPYLQLEIKLEEKKLDIELFCSVGLPLMSENITSLPFHPSLRLRECIFLSLESDEFEDPRFKKAFIILLFCLKHYYPMFFKKYFKSHKRIQKLIPTEVTSELIKLKKLTLDKLALYL